MQAAHEDALSRLQADMERAKDAEQALQQQMIARNATIAESTQQLDQLQAVVNDLQSQLGECHCHLISGDVLPWTKEPVSMALLLLLRALA